LSAFGCADRDCDQWYAFETPSEIHGGVVGKRTFYYGKAGLSAALSGVDVDCSQSKTAIAVGQAGTILRTDDLAHWSLVPSPVNTSLHDVAILTFEAIAVGDAGTVLVSKDLGLTWKPVDLGIADDIIQMSFPACDPGLPADGPGLLMTSSGQFYSRAVFSGEWQRQLPDAPGKPRTMLLFDQVGLDSFGGLRVQIAIGSRLWVMNPRENGDLTDQAWETSRRRFLRSSINPRCSPKARLITIATDGVAREIERYDLTSAQ